MTTTEEAPLVTAQAIVEIDGQERIYEASDRAFRRATFLAEKKARALLRRRGLSVKFGNVAKRRCPDCEPYVTKTVFTVTDLPVPSPIDDLDWLIEDWG